MGLVEDAPVGGPAYEVEHQVLPLGRPIGKDGAAVNGPQGGDALTPGMQLPKACRTHPDHKEGRGVSKAIVLLDLYDLFACVLGRSSVYSASACRCSEQGEHMPSNK